PTARVLTSDLEQLASLGGIVLLNPLTPCSKLSGTCRPFVVAKADGVEGRMVAACELNERLANIPLLELPSPLQILQVAMGSCLGAELDCASWFWQLPLPKHLHSSFAFRWKGQGVWGYAALPQGFAASPVIAHAAATALTTCYLLPKLVWID